jgi:glycosyltransferase involved in cell wall biosynthesis
MGYGFLARSALHHARRTGRPFVFTRLLHARARQPQEGQYDQIAREADAVIALTEHERHALVAHKGVAPERVHVTGVGPILSGEFDVVAFRRAHGIAGPYVLFLGRHVASKGLESLLDAARRVWRVRPEIRFVFAGPPSRWSARLLRERGEARVHALGAIDLETKTAALAGCELLCLPSRKESFGGVFTEAWALGKPVIGGRIPEIASIVEDGLTGLLSGPDPAELADRLLALLRDPARARALGEAGRARVAERWSWEKLAERTEAVYAALV